VDPEMRTSENGFGFYELSLQIKTSNNSEDDIKHKIVDYLLS
jgi:hypothetical protein